MSWWRRDTGIAVAVGIASLTLLLCTADQGFVRDEGYYFHAAEQYYGWFEGLWHNLWRGAPWLSFDDDALRQAFGYNREHPGLVKILMGFTHALLHGWLGHGTSFRLAGMLLAATGQSFLYLLGARWFGRGVGLLAPLLLVLCPRVFFHMHLACFDAPIMAFGILVVYGFSRATEEQRWILPTALAFGLALATKHNAVFMAPTLLGAYALAHLRDFRRTNQGLQLPRLPVVLVVMALVGPFMLYLFYPFGWHAPFERLGAYYAYHLQHEHYPVDYFGTLYVAPPFPVHFPFVMSAVTIPVTILVLGMVGFGWILWRGGRALRRGNVDLPAWLLVASTAVPPMIIAAPSVPIFGGTKHWMTMMPFFCLLAAATLWSAAKAAGARLGHGAATAAVLALALVGPAYETLRTHPLEHTYYNELIAGHSGGAALGMPRTFWGGDARGLLPYLNEHAEAGAVVFGDRMNEYDFRAYQRDGLLRSDLRWTHNIETADWAFINHQREYRDQEYRAWIRSGSRRAAAQLAIDHVPIVSLYKL